MRALVTGGAGFIGSHIAERLVRADHEVRVLDDLSAGKRSNLSAVAGDVELVVADVRDAAMVEDLARGCEVIFHEAAIVSVPYSVEHPMQTNAVNVAGTLNVLEAARRQGVRRVVFACSAAVYGEDPRQPKSESLLPAPVSPYGVEKLASEHYLAAWSRLFGIETVSLRYFNVFGPRQDPSSPYSGVISIFVSRILAGQPVTIFGDGEQYRDFVYVDNVVDANIAAATRAGVSGRTFNIGCGRRTTLNQLVAILGRIAGRVVEQRHDAPRPGDIRESLADISRARSELGYEPRIDVDEGLARLVEDVRRA